MIIGVTLLGTGFLSVGTSTGGPSGAGELIGPCFPRGGILSRPVGSRLGGVTSRDEDGVAAGALPRHHADPFDRMLIAQAARRQLVVVTADRRFTDYGVLTLS
jgi:hypothetical protein